MIEFHDAGVPFHRLLAVEVRKLFDTRTGTIVTAVLIAVTLAAVIGRGLAAGPRLHTLIGTAGIGFGTLLPVLGILSVTGEWSHRTVLTTFALEPRRLRVMAAKCAAASAAAVAASLFAMLAAVPVTALTARVQGVPADWDAAPLALLGWTAANVLVVALGLAAGLLLLNAPAAIVVCLSSTIVWTLIAKLGAPGQALAEWCDLNRTTGPLAAGDATSGDAARLAVSAAVCIAAPLAAGMVRVARREVR